MVLLSLFVIHVVDIEIRFLHGHKLTVVCGFKYLWRQLLLLLLVSIHFRTFVNDFGASRLSSPICIRSEGSLLNLWIVQSLFLTLIAKNVGSKVLVLFIFTAAVSTYYCRLNLSVCVSLIHVSPVSRVSHQRTIAFLASAIHSHSPSVQLLVLSLLGSLLLSHWLPLFGLLLSA